MNRRHFFRDTRWSARFDAGGPRLLIVAMAVCWLANGSALARERGDDDDNGRFCSQTAKLISRACGHEVQDDFLMASAKCINLSDQAEREECFAEARASRSEGRQLCEEQRAGRLDACESLGEGRYDPDFDPALFDEDFANLTNPNPYFPLGIGYRWEYKGGDEFNTVEDMNETKLIAGVKCIVLRDLVTIGGDLAEATDDWYTQAKDGNTWYCGEEVKNFESFDGDVPRVAELVSIAGRFKAGIDRDKPGVIFQASPIRGAVYVEEFSLGNAEDVTEILSTTYSFGKDAELDRLVPKKLAKLLCSGNCVVTKNFSLLEPGIFARKYYASEIGFFLEVNPDEGEILQLVDCNFDSRCTELPPP